MAISLSYTFTPSTRIRSAQVNANFALLATRALDKTGDTMTGALVLTTLAASGTLAASVTANQNNYAPTGFASATVWNLTPTAARTITGISASQVTGRILLINNASDSFALTLSDQDSSSTSTNRFRCPFATDAVIDPGSAALLFYNGTMWNVIAGVA